MTEGGIAEELCAPDVISPAQFQELWSGNCERSAEFNLALAVLEQAIEDLMKHRGARASDRQRLYRQAHVWVLSNDRRWPYSFVNVCEILDVSASCMRRQLVATSGSHGSMGAVPAELRSRAEALRVEDDGDVLRRTMDDGEHVDDVAFA